MAIIFKYPAFHDLPFSSMQTNSNSIRMGVQRNPIIEEIDVWHINSKPYGAWAVRIKLKREAPQTAFFHHEAEAYKFRDYISNLARKLYKANIYPD